MRIEVSHQVGTEIRRISGLLKVTEDDLLRRLLQMPSGPREPLPTPQAATPQANGGFRTREGVLPVGLRLRKVFKGKEYTAVVERDGIHVAGIAQVFLSPSLAGVAVTGYNTNGWVFWEYLDERTQRWRPLDELRQP